MPLSTDEKYALTQKLSTAVQRLCLFPDAQFSDSSNLEALKLLASLKSKSNT